MKLFQMNENIKIKKLLYIILVFFICIILIVLFPTLSNIIYEIMLETYLNVILKEMLSMKKISQGVSSSYMCRNMCDIYKIEY